MTKIKFKVQFYLAVTMFLCSIILNTQAVEVQDQEKLINEPYTQQLADYEIEDGSRFALCRDFSAYINRQTPFYYYVGLKPDPLFKDFKLPRLKSVDQDYGIAVVKEKIDSYFEDSLEKELDKQKTIELTQKHNSNWLNGDYFKYDVSFYTAYIDVNQSGQKNHLLISKLVYPLTKRNAEFEYYPIGINASLYSYSPLNKDGSYKHMNKFSLSGLPFFYRGRFYVANFSHVSNPDRTRLTVHISEPKVPSFVTEGLYMGRAVCQLGIWMKD